MILWIDALTNRTQTDVDRARELKAKGYESLTPEEKAEWIAGLKGSLNEQDVLRVQNNIQLLSDTLDIGLTVTTDFSMAPAESLWAEIYDNVSAVRGAYAIHHDTPEVPQRPFNTFEKWNAIEQILADVHQILNDNFSYYCGGEIYCGDETGLLL